MNLVEEDNFFNGGCFGLFGNKKQSTSGSLNLFSGMPESSNAFKKKPAQSVTPPDKDNPSPDQVISILAGEMTKLSVQEREKAENDVHGILGSNLEEIPEVLQQCVSEMEFFLEANKRGTAFELAEAMDRAYTSNFDFRAMFARAERYEPSAAAERMIRFFDLKKTLFRTELLTKDILLEHLDEDDMESLRSGGLQFCPARDSAGRPIMAIMLGLRKYKRPENAQRACFYMYCVLAQDVEAQKRGIVNVSYAVGTPVFKSVQIGLRQAIPLHIACQHFAYDDPFAYWSAGKGIFLLNKVHRVRFRSHLGTHVECQYALATYGIPKNALPVDEMGNFSTDFHLAWIQKRKEVEECQPIPYQPRNASPSYPQNGTSPFSLERSVTESTSPVPQSFGQIRDPRPSDILCGRGKTVVEHPGNAWFRDLVDKTMMQYESCTRTEKASLGAMIVTMVKDAGGRFLKPEDDGDYWEEVDDHTARKKVAHTFRNRRKFHGQFRSGSPMGTSNNSGGAMSTS
mmetsp:Transcript_86320/g.249299  ORF Transcript_86320/g.249299 Transcript_86320/m.249299 type:complete len:513 (-) Transcript_86320:61-1599(-)